MSEHDQDKTEDPTPFKLQKAREKGQIARGMDLPFFASLLGLLLFVTLFGASTFEAISRSMASSLSVSVASANENNIIRLSIAQIYGPALRVILIFCACTISFILLVQILQNKGLLFTTHPLKPDFTKLNPAKGLRRIFSLKTLKEAAKNILKMSIYLGGTFLIIRHCISHYGPSLTDGDAVAGAIYASGLKLLYLYLVLSFGFALIDQVIVRKEFFKQMRMNRSELKREVKDREGEPRIKQKRKELHREFTKTSGSLGALDGSDMLIVNPQHYAVALKYDAQTMTAPIIATKGRNRIALRLKSRAASLNIPVLANPPLARALFRQSAIGQTISADQFRAVADSYAKIARLRSGQGLRAEERGENLHQGSEAAC